MTIALYRRYRSATFGELIGQDHIARTLRNEVSTGGIAHAYLFTGIRGTGKTSAARILARAVNCLAASEGEPCNACSGCLEILGGGAVDVLEIDAASNRGIDEIRDLREKVKYLPALLRRKVYIIDEAHMLTTEAWNAFLKTLEEPPDHVLFVLATTEAHKIPETVRSRVQRFDFRRVDLGAITDHLERVAEREGIDAERPALELLARSGRGSVRDALSLLDAAIAGGERPLTLVAVRRALGFADPALVADLLNAIAAGDAASALRACAAAFEAGADAAQLLRETARLARAAEFFAMEFGEGAEVGDEEAVLCRRLATVGRPGLWLTAIDALNATQLALRQPVDVRIQVELCLLRLVQEARGAVSSLAELGARVTALEGGTVPTQRPEMSPSRPAPRDEVSASQAPPATVAAGPTPQVPEASPAGTADAPAEPAGPSPSLEGPAGEHATGVPGHWSERWPALVDAVNRRDVMLAGVLRGCRPSDDQSSGSLLHVVASGDFHLGRLRDRVKLALLGEVASALAGDGTAVVVEVGLDSKATSVTPAAARVDAESSTQSALDAFPGSRIVASKLRDEAGDVAGRAG